MSDTTERTIIIYFLDPSRLPLKAQGHGVLVEDGHLRVVRRPIGFDSGTQAGASAGTWSHYVVRDAAESAATTATETASERAREVGLTGQCCCQLSAPAAR